MAASFFFYDLETSGISPRDARIMQFAGQRTDMDLQPIGEPVNILIKLTPDVVPEPDAIMVTGITPQSTIADGVTEAEFLKIFYDEVVRPGTIFLGFNTVRFDDEFMRYLHYRNFYDAYEWQWCDDCSRWDLLDVVRMTRALRPEGIEWPFTADGKPTNRLELLTKLNGLNHEKAHDALDDVYATISVAKLIRDKQPKLFEYLLECRGKKECRKVVEDSYNSKQPFLYSSGRYPGEFGHTTAAILIGQHVQLPYGYVYDLRHDPDIFANMSADELVACAKYSREPDHIKLPVKTLKYNHCPAIAPLGILNDTGVQERLGLTVVTVQKHRDKLHANPGLIERLIKAHETVNDENSAYYSQSDKLGDPQHVDSQLYEGLISKQDAAVARKIRSALPDDLKNLDTFSSVMKDTRLKALLPLYKARNYPKLLSPDERALWDEFCRSRLVGGGTASRLAKFFKRLDELARQDGLSENQRFALEELHLYGESIMPLPDEEPAQ